MKRIKVLLAFIIVLVGISYHIYKIIYLNSQINALKFQRDVSLRLEDNPSMSEQDYYKKLSLRAINLLNEEQLIELAKMEWNYKLMINGEVFTGQNIKIDGDSLQIIIKEYREENSILPDDLRMQGQLKDFFKQIEIDSRIEPEITNKDEEYSTSIVYNFPRLLSGDKIKISMSEELSGRLGLNNKNYIVQIK